MHTLVRKRLGNVVGVGVIAVLGLFTAAAHASGGELASPSAGSSAEVSSAGSALAGAVSTPASDAFFAFLTGLTAEPILARLPRTRSAGKPLDTPPGAAALLGAKLIAVFPRDVGEFLFSNRATEIADAASAAKSLPGIQPAMRAKILAALERAKERQYENYGVLLVGLMDEGIGDRPLDATTPAPPDLFVASGLWASGQLLAVSVGKRELTDRFKPHGKRIIARFAERPKPTPPEMVAMQKLQFILKQVSQPEPQAEALKPALSAMLTLK